MLLCFFWSRCGKGKLEDGDGINLNDIEKVLPAWQVGIGAESPTAPLPLPSAWSGPKLSHWPLVPAGYSWMYRSGRWAGVGTCLGAKCPTVMCVWQPVLSCATGAGGRPDVDEMAHALATQQTGKLLSLDLKRLR